uniref:Thymidine kinase 2, mitochondrial-like isoform X1 n=1 Tax=Crassostrea virginica TaxID=6565 RepID=A0A8B8B0Y1_CRAVI|nr:thymidine kinase 2, mitochondrial-like isoform X1 [Crassostrea virginica]
MATQVCEGLKQTKEKERFTVCVEGNIASGKSTLLEHFKTNQNVETFEEPRGKWRNVHGFNALELFYRDHERWSMTLGTYIQLTMLEMHQKQTVKPVKLMERSIYSTKYCFMQNMKESGELQDIDHTIITEWFNWIIRNHDCRVDLIVYLQSKPETVHQRIKNRKLNGEEDIPLEFLQTMHDFHEDWLIKRSKFAVPSKVLVIPADSSLEEMHQIYAAKESEILCGMNIKSFL